MIMISVPVPKVTKNTKVTKVMEVTEVKEVTKVTKVTKVCIYGYDKILAIVEVSLPRAAYFDIPQIGVKNDLFQQNHLTTV